MIVTGVADFWRRRKVVIIIGVAFVCLVAVFVHVRIQPLRRSSSKERNAQNAVNLRKGSQPKHKPKVYAPPPFIINKLKEQKKGGFGWPQNSGGWKKPAPPSKGKKPGEDKGKPPPGPNKGQPAPPGKGKQPEAKGKQPPVPKKQLPESGKEVPGGKKDQPVPGKKQDAGGKDAFKPNNKDKIPKPIDPKEMEEDYEEWELENKQKGKGADKPDKKNGAKGKGKEGAKGRKQGKMDTLGEAEEAAKRKDDKKFNKAMGSMDKFDEGDPDEDGKVVVDQPGKPAQRPKDKQNPVAGMPREGNRGLGDNRADQGRKPGMKDRQGLGNQRGPQDRMDRPMGQPGQPGQNGRDRQGQQNQWNRQNQGQQGQQNQRNGPQGQQGQQNQWNRQNQGQQNQWNRQNQGQQGQQNQRNGPQGQQGQQSQWNRQNQGQQGQQNQRNGPQGQQGQQNQWNRQSQGQQGQQNQWNRQNQGQQNQRNAPQGQQGQQNQWNGQNQGQQGQQNQRNRQNQGQQNQWNGPQGQQGQQNQRNGPQSQQNQWNRQNQRQQGQQNQLNGPQGQQGNPNFRPQSMGDPVRQRKEGGGLMGTNRRLASMATSDVYVNTRTPVGTPPSLKRTKRQEAVVAAFQHAWKAYDKYAWGSDELNPVSRRGARSIFGMGLTIVDSLDTLWMMGLRDEYQKARAWVAENLNIAGNANTVSVFETTIRVLGGLLSAFHLTADKMYLDKATQLGNRLLPAFTTPSGIPASSVTLGSGSHGTGTTTVAEAGTLQLEFRDLYRATGNETYKRACDRALDQILSASEGRMVPMTIDVSSGRFMGAVFSAGAGVDSYYEYLLKQWLQSGRTEVKFRDAYVKSTREVLSSLVSVTKPHNMAFLSQKASRQGMGSTSMDHLSCFYPGMLALGVMNEVLPEARPMAQNLTHTCYYMYNITTPTHLAPEIFRLNVRPGKDDVLRSNDPRNIQRPETVESLFYLYRLTKDVKYRDWAWKVFEAFRNSSKLEGAGYTSLSSVYSKGQYKDRMESFFLAETLKYLFLIFEEDDSFLSLNEWVFNTEAHPLPIWKVT